MPQAVESIHPAQLQLRVVILSAQGDKILEDETSTIVVIYGVEIGATNILLSCGRSLRWTARGGWECWRDHRRLIPYENVHLHVLRA